MAPRTILKMDEVVRLNFLNRIEIEKKHDEPEGPQPLRLNHEIVTIPNFQVDPRPRPKDSM